MWRTTLPYNMCFAALITKLSHWRRHKLRVLRCCSCTASNSFLPCHLETTKLNDRLNLNIYIYIYILFIFFIHTIYSIWLLWWIIESLGKLMFSFLLLWPPSELLSTWLMQVSQETYMAAWLEAPSFDILFSRGDHGETASAFQYGCMDVWMYHVP